MKAIRVMTILGSGALVASCTSLMDVEGYSFEPAPPVMEGPSAPMPGAGGAGGSSVDASCATLTGCPASGEMDPSGIGGSTVESSSSGAPLDAGSAAPEADSGAVCLGCRIDGACIAAGSPAPAPCFVCDPARATTAYSPAPGRPCGDSARRECDAPDTCDDSGECAPNYAADDEACDDGDACSIGDRCVDGQCIAAERQPCGPAQSCNPETGACDCAGCLVDGVCHANGALESPDNPCRVCDADLNPGAFTVRVGMACGAAADVCSGADTCDSSGVCVPNHLGTGTACGPGATLCPPDICDGSGTCLSRASSRREICFNSVDDDCNGSTDEGCFDGPPDVGGE